jgi:CspA family cold shock protein
MKAMLPIFKRVCYNIPINRSAAVHSSSNSCFQPPALDLIRFISQSPMQTGTIAGITDKGFGFIKVEGAEKDLFFHSNELIDVSFDSLRQGDAVTFEIADGPKGPFATSVRKA